MLFFLYQVDILVSKDMVYYKTIIMHIILSSVYQLSEYYILHYYSFIIDPYLQDYVL
jgi:hypothetical protein